MSDKSYKVFGADVGDHAVVEGYNARAWGFECELSYGDGGWSLTIGKETISNVEMSFGLLHHLEDKDRTTFVLQFSGSRIAREIVANDDDMVVLGQRKDLESLTHVVLSMPRAWGENVKSHHWLKFITLGGEQFTLVGMPQHGSVYASPEERIDGKSWTVDSEWSCTAGKTSIYFTDAGPLLFRGARMASYVHWTERAEELLKNTDYDLFVVDFSPVSLALAEAEMPPDVELVGQFAINRLPTLVFAVRSTRRDEKLYFPVDDLTKKTVMFEGFPYNLKCSFAPAKQIAA
jgi:hypothetical protein